MVQTASGKMVFARFRQLAQVSPEGEEAGLNGHASEEGRQAEVTDSGVLEGVS